MSHKVICALVASDQYNAPTLKKACFGTLFAYGKQLLTDAQVSLDEMPQSLMVEMLRDHAARRVEHMPGFEQQLSKIEPFSLLELPSPHDGPDSEAGGSKDAGKNKRKRRP